jgi:hypothetical protein
MSGPDPGAKKRLVWTLVLFALLDTVIPVPLLALALLWGVWKRPAWFVEAVDLLHRPVASE